VYFVADPERIQSGEASDLRWECAGDIPDVRIAVLTVPEVVLGPFPARGSVRVRPTRSTAYALWPRSTNNTQAASAHATVFVTP
jgi:hypothetical protein